jgi:DNA processing protein
MVLVCSTCTMDKPQTETDAYLILNALPEVGPVMATRLLAAFENDILAVFSANEKQLCAVKGVGKKSAQSILDWQQAFDLDKEIQEMQQREIDYLTYKDKDYPELLRQLPDAPMGLYWQGHYRLDRPCIAIIGTRRATLYGHSVAKRFARELAGLGFCIVSGLARGTDTAAHEGAIEGGGKTIAVFGCGLRTIYPAENLALYRRILEEGAAVSEFSLAQRANRQTFPMRNRIVAGMSQAVIVIESDAAGGSMITARFAGEQGRQLFAVPGRIDQPSSRGCHQLIRDGAILTTSVDDVLEELQYRRQSFQLDLDLAEQQRAQESHNIVAGLTEDEASVFAVLGNGEALRPDAIADSLNIAPWDAGSLLVRLELKGLILKRVDGCYEARAGL